MYKIYFLDNTINVFLIIFPQYYKYMKEGNLESSRKPSFYFYVNYCYKKIKIILCGNKIILLNLNINKLCN